MAEAVDAAYRPRVREDVRHVVLDGELVLYDPVTASVHQLDRIAALVWPFMDGEATIAELAADLADAFAAPEARVRSDLLGLVAHLRSHSLLADHRPPERETPAPAKPGYLVDPPSP